MPQERHDEARRNRDRMPEIAGLVDSLREVFGPGVRVRWASENGVEVGVRSTQWKDDECA